jgi:hypothetical protein
MSIALEAKVAELENQVGELKRQIEKLSILRSGDPLPLDKLDIVRRLTALEQRGKPGPKPKDSNG